MGSGQTSPLQDERQDGRAERRVVAELLQVAAVLPFGPNGHLDETHQSEEGHRQTLGHQSEAEPRTQLQEEEERLSETFLFLLKPLPHIPLALK